MSKLGQLDYKDLGKGLLVAAGTAFFASISVSLNAGRLPNKQELIGSGIAALAALSAYLVKNLFTNSNGEIGKQEN